MKAYKILNLNGNKFVLPEGMPAKEIQSLVGFLALFQCTASEYNYATGKYMHYLGEGISIQLETLELGDKAEVKAQCELTYAEWQAKQKAKDAAAETSA